MTELLDRLTAFQENPECMTLLAESCDFSSPGIAAVAYQGVALMVAENIAELGNSRGGLDRLLAWTQALSWQEQNRPQLLFGSSKNRLAYYYVEQAFPNSLPMALAALSDETGVPPHGARRLLETTFLAALASLSNDPEKRLDIATIATVLNVEQPVGDTTGRAAAQSYRASPHKDAPNNTNRPIPDGSSRPEPLKASNSKRAEAFIPQASLKSRDEKPAGLAKNWLLLMALAASIVTLLGFGIAILNSRDGEIADRQALDGSQTTTGSSEQAQLDKAEGHGEADGGGHMALDIKMSDIDNPESSAAGSFHLTLDRETGEVCFTVKASNIEGPFRSHVHVGGASVVGGIAVDFGQVENGETGCVENLPVDTASIVADPAGHYVVLHDKTGQWNVRGQLAEAASGAAADSAADVVDHDGGGAIIVIENGTIFLKGKVRDKAAAAEFVASLDDLAADTPIVNNLTITADAPLPSGRVVIADNVFFDVDSDQIKVANETLGAIVLLAESRADWVLTVVGHTDDNGADTYNLELSLRRAAAIRDVLIELGLPDETLRIRGAGETAPIASNATADGRSENRRIEFEFQPEGHAAMTHDQTS